MRARTLPDVRLGQQLAARRQRLSLSQTAVAHAAGISTGSLANYECGRCCIPRERWDALDRALAAAERRKAIVDAALAAAAV